MQESTRYWFTHCVVPHNMRDVSEECHEMMHDHLFLGLNIVLISCLVFAALIIIGAYTPASTQQPVVPYYPFYMG
ncbi:MAG: hypothetical protein HRT88_04820 [Lentisphaeraceae bacterium]|nr:hypothetical protein [Lentisphaeraceae bacterium]